MKKSMIVLVAVFAAFTFSSCIKTRNCVCKDSTTGVVSGTYPIKGTKTQSKTACAAMSDGSETCTLD